MRNSIGAFVATVLFLTELDRVIVAIRAQGSGDAELWVLQPSPAD